jgi:hypothetical protein
MNIIPSSYPNAIELLKHIDFEIEGDTFLFGTSIPIFFKNLFSGRSNFPEEISKI